MTTEERVGALLEAGDGQEAATLAIRQYGPQVLHVLRSTLRNEADAEDAFALFAERLWRGIATFRGESSMRTWALRIATHTALNYRQQAWRRLERGFKSGEASALAARISTATAVRAEQQRQALDRLRAKLALEDQLLILLRIDQRLSWAEVAQVLSRDGQVSLEKEAVMKRYERLRERLAKLAADEGLIS